MAAIDTTRPRDRDMFNEMNKHKDETIWVTVRPNWEPPPVLIPDDSPKKKKKGKRLKDWER